MDREELWRSLLPMMEQNPEYQQALQNVKAVEQEYLALSETLASKQREILERYIAACEELDDTLLYLAYQIGLAQSLPLGEGVKNL